MKRMAVKILALVVAVSIFASLAFVSASAANVCYDVSGDLSTTKTFEVKVGGKIFSSEKIVLTQTKGDTRQTWYSKVKIAPIYGCFYVSVYDNTAGKWVYRNKKWQSKNFTIKSSQLKKKHNYTVTVEGKTGRNIFDGYDATPYIFEKWLSYPSWRATKTGGNISFCR